MKRLAATLGLALALLGCSHAPTFERPDAALRGEPGFETRARIALATAPGTDPRFAREVVLALARRPGLAAVSSSAAPDYVARLRVERRTDGTLASFFVCCPGFLVFAPAWYGLEWRYELETSLALERPSGELAGRSVAVMLCRAHYTPFAEGARAELGWLLPVWPFAALQEGALATVAPADEGVLDDAFLKQHGRAWGDEVAAMLAAAVARDRRASAP